MGISVEAWRLAVGLHNIKTGGGTILHRRRRARSSIPGDSENYSGGGGTIVSVLALGLKHSCLLLLNSFNEPLTVLLLLLYIFPACQAADQPNVLGSSSYMYLLITTGLLLSLLLMIFGVLTLSTHTQEVHADLKVQDLPTPLSPPSFEAPPAHGSSVTLLYFIKYHFSCNMYGFNT